MNWEEDNAWVDLSNIVRETAKELFGVTTGKKKGDKGDMERRSTGRYLRKKEAWKEWHKRKDLRSFCTNNKAKEAVAKAKKEASAMYEKLDAKEGENMVYKVAKQSDRAAKDVQHQADKGR
ncbi:uncharacterized protein LOC119585530 [Penaeus monodon]|uniref:uncharacterized protein LOC119585530 n=1 Tax=Penaeus monodon TaxID=6687 RepID=UPI0018A7A8E6|nr:uncharacterized protein LOC119585530 [Penaeus monodon]